MRSTDGEKKCRMLLHGIQLLPQQQYKKYEFEKFVTLSDNGETTQAFTVMVSVIMVTYEKIIVLWGDKSSFQSHVKCCSVNFSLVLMCIEDSVVTQQGKHLQ